MNQHEIAMEDMKLNWRQEAQARANEEAKDNRLTGDEALEFVNGRMLEIYDELAAEAEND